MNKLGKQSHKRTQKRFLKIQDGVENNNVNQNSIGFTMQSLGRGEEIGH